MKRKFLCARDGGNGMVHFHRENMSPAVGPDGVEMAAGAEM